MYSEHSFLHYERGFAHMKEEYIKQIVELLHKCNDIPLLDLVYKLLKEC